MIDLCWFMTCCGVLYFIKWLYINFSRICWNIIYIYIYIYIYIWEAGLDLVRKYVDVIRKYVDLVRKYMVLVGKYVEGVRYKKRRT